uniref:Uncharacterized protein n=1 Tax=viral metagenome TaxID=1070528 RepID=A0A6C0ACT4_9ZZZZ
MNRIRYNKGVYEVLVTPNITISPDSELISGGWTDEYLKGFTVKTFEDKQDAYYFSSELPELDWVKLIRTQKDFFNTIESKVETVLDSHNFTYEIKSKMMKPDQAKHIMFDRVLKHGIRFNLTTHMNDLVSVVVTNPWYENLEDMVSVLRNIADLRISKIIRNNKTITLVGVNHLNFNYSIKLIPTLIKHAIDWKDKNVHSKSDMNEFKQVMEEMFIMQSKLDKKSRLR